VRVGFFGFSCFLISLAYWASNISALSIPESHHYIQFIAKGTPNFFRILGRSENNCLGLVQQNKGKIQCHLKALKTGFALRDKHMLKYLDAKTHPMVTLTFEAKGDRFRGIVELKGKQVPVEGSYVASPLKFEFKVNINDFEIQVPRYFGAGIEPDISVSAGLR